MVKHRVTAQAVLHQQSPLEQQHTPATHLCTLSEAPADTDTKQRYECSFHRSGAMQRMKGVWQLADTTMSRTQQHQEKACGCLLLFITRQAFMRMVWTHRLALMAA
jgi:hypothetical protein